MLKNYLHFHCPVSKFLHLVQCDYSLFMFLFAKNFQLRLIRKFSHLSRAMNAYKVFKYAFSFTSLFTNVRKINVVENFTKILFLLYLSLEFFVAMCAQCDFMYKTRFCWREIFPRVGKVEREKSSRVCWCAHVDYTFLRLRNKRPLNILFTTIHAAYSSSHATQQEMFPLTEISLFPYRMHSIVDEGLSHEHFPSSLTSWLLLCVLFAYFYERAIKMDIDDIVVWRLISLSTYNFSILQFTAQWINVSTNYKAQGIVHRELSRFNCRPCRTLIIITTHLCLNA